MERPLVATALMLILVSGIATGRTNPRLRSHRSKHLVSQQAERNSQVSAPESSAFEPTAVPISLLLLVLTGLVAIAVAALLGALFPAHQKHLQPALAHATLRSSEAIRFK
jgi:hypothetical protein